LAAACIESAKNETKRTKMPRHPIPLAILIGLATILAAFAQQNSRQPGTTQPAARQPAVARPSAPATARQQVSYALGRNFAANLTHNEIECDLEFLLAGISDAFRKVPPKWTDAQLQPVLQRFEQEMQQKAMDRIQRLATKNQQEAARFFAENGRREGVQTTASGLQYRAIRQGEGPSPTLSDRVRCNYRGTLLNGTEFDNSANHGGPAEFRVDEVIPGWTEALQKMRVGDKWQLFVPADLAYQMSPPPDSIIEPNSMLIFEIELLEVLPQ
jgi:FKBP-type peptidyl-prolyl cis-trans isomerase